MNCPNKDPDEELIRKQHKEVRTHGCTNCECGKVIIPWSRGLSRSCSKCLYCETFFCIECAEKHFGMTINAWKINNQ